MAGRVASALLATLAAMAVAVAAPPRPAAAVEVARAASAPYLPTVSHATDVGAVTGVVVAAPQTCDAAGVCTDGDGGPEGEEPPGNKRGWDSGAPAPTWVPPTAGTSVIFDSPPPAEGSGDAVGGAGDGGADGGSDDDEDDDVEDAATMLGTPLAVGAPMAAASGSDCTTLSGAAAGRCFGVAFQVATNALRAAASRPPVAYNGRVSALATAWSEHLRALGGLKRADLSSQVGPHGTYVSGQNLALVPATATDPVGASMGAWSARPGNRGLLLGSATHMGVGVVKGTDGRWWVSYFLATCFEVDKSGCPVDEAGGGGGGGGGDDGRGRDDGEGGEDGGGGDGGGAVPLAPHFTRPWLSMCKVNTCVREGGDSRCWFVGDTTCADFAARIGCDERFCEAGVPPAPVCGSNGVTYDTECLADVASCQQGFAFKISKWTAC